MSNYTKTIILSYLKVILTIAVILLAGIFLYKSIKYIRGMIKRRKLVKRIKKVCRRRQYELKINDSPMKSIFRRTSVPELTITAGDRSYSVKFITLINPVNKYTLDGFDHIYETTNFAPRFVNFKSYRSGITAKGIGKLYFPHSVQVDGKNMREYTRGKKVIEFPKPKEGSCNIVCINPTAVEMLKVVGSGTELIFDGDFYHDCYIYSGKGLLRFLENLENEGTRKRAS